MPALLSIDGTRSTTQPPSRASPLTRPRRGRGLRQSVLTSFHKDPGKDAPHVGGVLHEQAATRLQAECDVRGVLVRAGCNRCRSTCCMASHSSTPPAPPPHTVSGTHSGTAEAATRANRAAYCSVYESMGFAAVVCSLLPGASWLRQHAYGWGPFSSVPRVCPVKGCSRLQCTLEKVRVRGWRISRTSGSGRRLPWRFSNFASNLTAFERVEGDPAP